jgi:hypothetical protein
MTKLNSTVHINNEKGSFVFGPESEDVPSWVFDKLKSDGTYELLTGEQPEDFDIESPAQVAERYPERFGGQQNEGETSTEDETAAEEVPYEKRKADDLRTLAANRGIETDGLNKAELVAALQGADEQSSNAGQ